MKTLWVMVCLALPVCLGAEESKPVRVYTNEDLERVAPYRDQTGVSSVPAEGASSPGGEREGASSSRRSRSRSPREPAERTGAVSERGASYWRREAEKVREKVRQLQQRALGFKARIEQKRRDPKVFPYSDPQIRAWGQRVEEIEAQIRETEGAFEERARRAGAMPGWLR